MMMMSHLGMTQWHEVETPSLIELMANWVNDSDA
jgi:hypothetical protein